MKKRDIFPAVIIVVLCSAVLTFAQAEGIRKKKPQRHEYGNVVMNNSSEKIKWRLWFITTGFTGQSIHADSVMWI